MPDFKGFTLVELVIVIIILGILAAFVVPKYIALEASARIKVVNKLKGTIGNAATMARLTAKAKGVKSGVGSVNCFV